MVVKVSSKVGQAFTRSLDGLSLAEGSMLLRLRRASIALLCLVGAVGLGLVLFISQLGWPGVLSGPLPGTPSRVGTVHDAIALTSPGQAIATARPAAVAAGRPAGGVARQGSHAGGNSQLGHVKKLADVRGAGPTTGVGQPTAQSPSPPAAEPEPVTPAPTGATIPSAPQPSSPEKATGNSKSSEAAVAKAVSDSSKSAAATATKSQGQKSAADKSSSSASSKSSEASSAKAHRDESAAKAKAKAPSPPPVSPEKSAPATPSPAAAKEAADAAKSD